MFYVITIIFSIITMAFIFSSSGKPKKEQEKLFFLYLPVIVIYMVIMVLNGWSGSGTENLFVDY